MLRSAKIDGDDVYLALPSIEELDEISATEATGKRSCHDHPVVRGDDPFAVAALGEP